MNIYGLLLIIFLFDKGKSENSLAERPRLLEDKNIINELDNEKYFDIGKKFKSEHLVKAIAEKCDCKNDLLSTQLELYIMRYIRIFLFVLNLQGKMTLIEDDEERTIDLIFAINGRDLKFMRDMSENFGAGKILDNLHRLDAILSEGFQLLKPDEPEENFIDSFVQYPTYILKEYLLSKDLHFALFLVCIVALLFCRIYSYFPLWTSIFTLLNFLIISEGYIRYLLKKKELETEDYVRLMKNTKNECNPGEESFFSYIWKLNPFIEDKCLNYLKRINSNSADNLFPFESVVNVYKYYFLEIPFKEFGSCLRYFSEGIYGNLPSFLRPILMIPTYILLFIFLFGLIVLFMKPRLHFGGYGFNFGIGFGERPDRTENNRYMRLQEGSESAETNRIQNLAGSLTGKSIKEEEKEEGEGKGEQQQQQQQQKLQISLPDSDKVLNNEQVSEQWEKERDHRMKEEGRKE